MSQLQIEEYYLEALDNLEFGKIVEAKRLFEKIISDNPQYGRAYTYLGWIYHRYFMDFAMAEEMYNMGLKYAPLFPVTYTNYIYLLTETDKWEHLKYLLDKADKITGVKKSVIYFHYGRLFEQNENYEAALDYYVKGKKATFEEMELEQFELCIERCQSKQLSGKKWFSQIS